MTTNTAIVPIRPATKPRSAPCGANTPITWGDLFLILENHPADLQMAVLRKIAELDAAG